MVMIVIEHLENTLGEWILIEYANAARIIGEEKLLVTRLCPPPEVEEAFSSYLGKFRWTCKRVDKLYSVDRLIVLDPQASHPLKPSDTSMADAVVIGGILGDHPPRGRTRELLTRRLAKAAVRNIGEGQYSIDGAAYVAHRILNEGVPLERIEYVDGMTLYKQVGGIYHEINLPYRYPLVDGKPLISERLLKYLGGKISYDELEMILHRKGKNK